MKIARPTLLINEEKCKANILAMVDKAKRSSAELIPHFKTHQSIAIGEWYREVGVRKITVSSVEMAEYFANAGWDDIYIAFPCNVLEVDAINNLARRIKLTLLFSNKESISLLSKRLLHQVNARIEIDSGTGRTGFHYNDIEQISEAINLINESVYLTNLGLYSHAGHSYNANGKNQIVEIFDEVKSRLLRLKNHFNLPLGFGDTPCCSVAEDFEEFESIHPGNFVFYDLMQTAIGSCKENQIGIALACPIVDKKASTHEIIMHAGGVHLSKDNLNTEKGAIYGKLMPLTPDGWEKSFDKCYVTALSQEHGIAKVSEEVFDLLKVGDVIGILPVHSCMTADCMGEYFTLKGEKLDHLKKHNV